MDPNYSMYRNLGGSFSVSTTGAPNVYGQEIPQNLIGSYSTLNEPALKLTCLTPQQLIQLQVMSQQHIQQLSAQLAAIQMTNIPSNSLPYVPPVQQATLPLSPLSHVSPFFPVGTSSVNTQFGQTLNSSVPGLHDGVASTVYNPSAYHSSLVGINDQIPKQLQVNAPISLVSTGNKSRAIAAPNNLPLQNAYQPQSDDSDTRSYYKLSPSSTNNLSPDMHKQDTESLDEPTFMQRPRQQVMPSPRVRPPPLSDRSRTSSDSTQSSLVNIDSTPLSDDENLSSSQKSPKYVNEDIKSPKEHINGDLKSPTIPRIKSKSLQMETRYKQDKCYGCMKKVFPMEKVGPVRGVVYHKGCFRCKQCNTTLNINNVFHNRSDSYDLSIYCKSHQPVSTEKGPKLDSESFEIKSALNAPKPSAVVPESERVPVHNYSYDVNARAIEHARKAPVADLQSGVKARTYAWSKSKRDNYVVPTDVVRSDEPVPEYNVDEYNSFQIENQPDYK